MNYDVRPICVLTAFTDGQDLFAAHYDEVSSKERKLAPDLDKYVGLELSGVLVGLGAYASGALVGYSATIVDKHIHYDLVTAYNVALFVHPDHRTGSLGGRLMLATKRASAERGASLMLWHAKPDTPLDTLLRKRGLKVQDIVYQEQLSPARPCLSPPA